MVLRSLHDRNGTQLIVHGIDMSEKMLVSAEKRKEGVPLEIANRLSFSLGDIRSIRTGKIYDVVISLFHVMSYQLNDNDLNKGFRLFIKKALPLTILTALLCLSGLYFLNNSYSFNSSILKIIFIGLASLTFPHILLEYLIEKNEK